MFCQTPVRHLVGTGTVERPNITVVRIATPLPYGTFGIWKALRFLLNCRINGGSNREEEMVLLL